MSNYTAQEIGLGFSAHEVTVNAEGVGFSAGSQIVVDLSATVNSITGTAPEPQSYATMLTGLLALGWGMFRRRSSTPRT